MKIAIAGGSGLIGDAITERLMSEGHHVYILTRNLNKVTKQGVTYVKWLDSNSAPENELDGIDVFINLAGESIGGKRWTSAQKARILDSRIKATRSSISLMKKLDKKPSVFLNASAIGYYGCSDTLTFTESDVAAKTNFLSEVTKVWEEEANAARDLNIRTVLIRTGVVLSEKGGALSQIVLPYRLFFGGTIGSGKQWVSWIHVDDLVRLVDFAMTNVTIEGPINATAPNPVQMKEFGKTIAKILNKPHWAPVPAIVLKGLLGEMNVLVADGQKVLPDKAQTHGFRFLYPQLESALRDILT